MRHGAILTFIFLAMVMGGPAARARLLYTPGDLLAPVGDGCVTTIRQDTLEEILANQKDASVLGSFGAVADANTRWATLGDGRPADRPAAQVLQAPEGWYIHSAGLRFQTLTPPGVTERYEALGYTEAFTLHEGEKALRRRELVFSADGQTVLQLAPARALAMAVKHWSYALTRGFPDGPSAAYVDWVLFADTPEVWRPGQRRIKVVFDRPPRDLHGKPARERPGEDDNPCLTLPEPGRAGPPGPGRPASPFEPGDTWTLPASFFVPGRATLESRLGWGASAGCPYCWADLGTGDGRAVFSVPPGWELVGARWQEGGRALVLPRVHAWEQRGREILSRPLPSAGWWRLPSAARWLAFEAIPQVAGHGHLWLSDLRFRHTDSRQLVQVTFGPTQSTGWYGRERLRYGATPPPKGDAP